MQSLPHLSGETDWKSLEVLQKHIKLKKKLKNPREQKLTRDHIHKAQAFGLDFQTVHPNIEDTETEKLHG